MRLSHEKDLKNSVDLDQTLPSVRIFHGCLVSIEKPVMWLTIRQQVMLKASDPQKHFPTHIKTATIHSFSCFYINSFQTTFNFFAICFHKY